MTIFFSGNEYKYELEGVAKLFFPVIRFDHIYGRPYKVDESYIISRMRKGKQHTYMWIYAVIDGKTSKRALRIENSTYEYAKECERILCVLLYKVLAEITDILPGWGVLTGIRPVATVQRLRREGMNDAEITSHLKDGYLVSDNKLKLAFETADNQTELFSRMQKKTYSLYISIPFCESRCSYCSFVSHAVNTKKSLERVGEYVALLCKELEYTAKLAYKLGLILQTIYIGGGTPTALSAEYLKQITDTVSRCFDVKSVLEYTIEAGRADSITEQKLKIIKEAGADRISVNPQTFNDDVLKAIGRKHTANQAVEKYIMAKDMGFDSINMDFIAGLPTDTLESFKDSIDKAVELNPSNITVHTLSIKRSSDLFESDGIEEYVKKVKTPEMMEYAQKILLKSGYKPYYLYRQKNTIGNLENVGYAKKGYESLYNVYIMDEIQTILACGAGGVTKLVKEQSDIINTVDDKDDLRIKRIFNFKYHFEYIDRFDEIINRKAEIIRFGESMLKIL